MIISTNGTTDTPVSIIDGNIRLDWYNSGTGYFGDYNPENPYDENFLDLEIYRRVGDDLWVLANNGLFSSNVRANSDIGHLENSLRLIWMILEKVIDFDGEYISEDAHNEICNILRFVD